MFCSKTPEWSKIQKEQYRVLFPDALNSSKEMHKVFYLFTEMFDIKHQLNEKEISNQIFSFLVFLPTLFFLSHFSFLSLHFLVVFSSYCTFSILPTHFSGYLLHLVSVYLSPSTDPPLVWYPVWPHYCWSNRNYILAQIYDAYKNISLVGDKEKNVMHMS